MIHDLEKLAHFTIETLKAHGANHAAVSVGRSRSVQTDWRKGELERIQDRTHRSIGIEVYVDERYAGFSTNDLRPEPLSEFLKQTVEMTRLLEPDPHRTLPTPPTSKEQLDLELWDPQASTRTVDERKKAIEGLNEALNSALDVLTPVSYSASMGDGWGEYYRMFSSGFSEFSRTSSFSKSVTISLKDSNGKLPLGWDGSYGRHLTDLRADDDIAAQALIRAKDQLNPTPISTNQYDVVIKNRAMGKLVSPLLVPLRGSLLHQRRSLWQDRLNDQIVSPLLSIWDVPHLVRGLGSAQFDSDGYPTVRRPLIESGELKTYLINHYYGQKMATSRTGSDTHNLVYSKGDTPFEDLIKNVKNGLLIERFLGGNCNNTTGNFSFGCAGRRIENGQLTSPFAEANLSGQIESFWRSLQSMADDPLIESANKVPSCLFGGAQVSGI